MQKLCIGCMREIETGSICPYCGMDEAAYHPLLQQLPPGTLLDGRYLLGKRIGRGGFGYTYLAMDQRLRHRVAVKELFLSDRMIRTRKRMVRAGRGRAEREWIRGIQEHFLEQTRSMAAVSDVPGMVVMLDYFEENGTAYQVMEYLEGIDLRHFLLRLDHRMTMSEILDIMMPVMQTLERLHRRGVLHRDISADNVMLLHDGGVRLIDMECPVTISGRGHAAGIVRRSYSPIEQIRGIDSMMGPWTDIYSLAVCIYYCLCGRFPERADLRVKRDSGRSQALLSAPLREAHLTNFQENILLRALAIWPQERISSIPEFREGLLSQEYLK